MAAATLDQAKREVCTIARRAFELGLQTYTGGNLSARVDGSDRCVIKPSGIGFAECTPDNLMVVELDGTIVEGEMTPSKDMPFHLEIYRVRPDVGGIVHFHSPWATGFATAGKNIPLFTLYAKQKLGQIAYVPLAPDGGTQGAREVGPAFADPSVNAALLCSHGTIGVGKTLLAAQHVAELIEASAHIAAVNNVVAQGG